MSSDKAPVVVAPFSSISAYATPSDNPSTGDASIAHSVAAPVAVTPEPALALDPLFAAPHSGLYNACIVIP